MCVCEEVLLGYRSALWGGSGASWAVKPWVCVCVCVTTDEIKKKATNINQRLGTKYEVSESELQSTYDACNLLLK